MPASGAHLGMDRGKQPVTHITFVRKRSFKNFEARI